MVVDQILQKILVDSDNISNDDKKLSTFFGKCAMARLLEVFLNNPDKKLNVEDILLEAGLSIKAIFVNMPFLLDNNMILKERYKQYKFYQLNTENILVRQISEFRDILVINNARTTSKKKNNRQVDTKFKKTRRTKQSKTT